jgi:hypothetical protein
MLVNTLILHGTSLVLRLAYVVACIRLVGCCFCPVRFCICLPVVCSIDVIRVLVTYIIKIGIHVDIVINTLITVTLM